MKNIHIFDLAKASDIWRRTSIRPLLGRDPRTNKIFFAWESKDSDVVLAALTAHQNDTDGTKMTFELYRALRTMMNAEKRGAKDD